MKINHTTRNKYGSSEWANCQTCRGSGIIQGDVDSLNLTTTVYCGCDVGLVTKLRYIERLVQTVEIKENIESLRLQLQIRAIRNVKKLCDRLKSGN